jgi:DNA-binding CsgD family transcriptional regulator
MVIVVTMVGPQPGSSGWSDLSQTQRIIGWLVSQGLTNQQIARRLYLSPHTVNYHLRQIFQKLGINSRVELARIVQEQTGGRPEELGGDGDPGA